MFFSFLVKGSGERAGFVGRESFRFRRERSRGEEGIELGIRI